MHPTLRELIETWRSSGFARAGATLTRRASWCRAWRRSTSGCLERATSRSRATAAPSAFPRDRPRFRNTFVELASTDSGLEAIVATITHSGKPVRGRSTPTAGAGGSQRARLRNGST